MEIILLNKIKTPVGASSEHLMSHSVINSHLLKWLNHQMFMHELMKLWLNRFFQNTESFSNEL